MAGYYVLVRMLDEDDGEKAATQFRVGHAVRYLEGLGSYSMTSFELDEDESPVVLAKRLIRHETGLVPPDDQVKLCSCPRKGREVHA